jgi:hypothetical protein
MITDQTILILGAGASADYRYPSGHALVKEICEGLRDPPRSQFGRDLMAADIPENQLRDFGLNMEAAQAGSVDAFLEHRRDFENAGKLSIARALIPHEKEEDLYGGWYPYLFNALNTSINEFKLNKFTIITFNYDRSLEHFLYKTVKNWYGVSEERAAELVLNIEIIHLHGVLSPLKFLYPNGRQYSPAISREILTNAAGNIRVMHEGVHHSVEFKNAIEWLARPDLKNVCFLGFGYHKMNLERLKMRTWGRARIFCSRHGITDAELEQIKRLFPPMPAGPVPPMLQFHYDDNGSQALPYLRSIGILPLS